MIHELKIAPKYFKSVISGEKTFEIRLNDRPFKKGDMLGLNEYDPDRKSYTGESCIAYIDYILDDPEYCKSGFVVMSIKLCRAEAIGKKVIIPKSKNTKELINSFFGNERPILYADTDSVFCEKDLECTRFMEKLVDNIIKEKYRKAK